MQSETVETGTLIAGRYRIGALLGRGGMAEVYEGHDDRLQRPVAVKVLRPDMAAREDVRNRFEFEARHAARLSHPNVVGIYDTGEDEGLPFLVMELLPGETLSDSIARGPVEQEWLKRVAGDVLNALGAAHAAGIVHRDIKPGNIVLAVDGCAKVTDFGIAKTLEVAAEEQGQHDLTSTNQLVGTPAYLAPERIDGAPATPRSDLYSLGVVLYEALSGAKPFTGATAIAVADAVQRATPTPLTELRPDADPALVRVIQQAMARDPGDRYGSAAEMLRELEAAPQTPPQGLNAVEPAGDSTQVIPVDSTRAVTAAAPAAVPASGSPARPAQARPRQPARRRSTPNLWPVAIAVGVLLLGLGLVLSMRDGDGNVSAGAGPGAEAAPQNPVAAELRSVADRLSVGDGAAGVEVAGDLRSIADKIDAGDDAGGDATNLLGKVAQMRADRRLGTQASQIAIDALKKVPGVDGSAADAPAAAPASSEGEGQGKDGKKGKEKDDD